MSPLFFNVNSESPLFMLQNSGDKVQKEKDHVEEQWRHGAKREEGEDHVSTVLQCEQWSLHCSRCRIVDMVQKQKKEKGKEKS